jgi:nucleotide-binding universal stress UspA family protein
MDPSGLDRIMVAVDGSESALHSVRYAASILDPRRFSVVLFHILTRVPESFIDVQKLPGYRYRLVSVDAWEQQQDKIIRDFMEKARQRLSEAGFPEGSVEVRIEERKVGIARDVAAELRNGYRGVVVGRKGMSELKDFMLGSIANKILELVSVPVWIVGGPHTGRKFLMCMDNSEGSMRTVRYLAEVLGGWKECEVSLFHAVRGHGGLRKFIREAFSSESDKSAIESLEKELNEAARLLEPSFDKAGAMLVSSGIGADSITKKIASCAGNCANAIMEEVEKGGYDTIVVGRRGLSKVEEFVMGRVSSKVIHLAGEKTVWVVA